MKNEKSTRKMFLVFCLLLVVVGLSCNSATGKNKDAKKTPPSKSGETCKLTPELEKNVKMHLVDALNVPAFYEIKVTAITTSSFDSFYNVTVSFTNTQQPGQPQAQEFLLTKDCNTLVLGKVANLSVNPIEEVLSKISLGDSPVTGKKGAKVTIVTYSDFQ